MEVIVVILLTLKQTKLANLCVLENKIRILCIKHPKNQVVARTNQTKNPSCSSLTFSNIDTLIQTGSKS